MRGRSKFCSFLVKTIVTLQSARLTRSHVIALLTAHLLKRTLLSKFISRSINVLLQKLAFTMIFACEHTSTPFPSWWTRTGHPLDNAKFCSSKRAIHRRASCHPNERCNWWESIVLGSKVKNCVEQIFAARELEAGWNVWKQHYSLVRHKTMLWISFRVSDSLCFSSMLFRCHSPRSFFSRFFLSLMFLFQRLMEIILRVCSRILRLRLFSLETPRTTREKLDAA